MSETPKTYMKRHLHSCTSTMIYQDLMWVSFFGVVLYINPPGFPLFQSFVEVHGLTSRAMEMANELGSPEDVDCKCPVYYFEM